MRGPREPVLLLGLSAWAGGASAWWLWAVDQPGWWGTALAAGLAGAAAMARLGHRIAALLLIVGLALGASSTAAHLAATRPPALAELVGREVTVEVAVEAVRQSPGDGIGAQPAVRVIGLARQVGTDELALRSTTPVLLVGHPGVLGQPHRGQVLNATGSLLPPSPLRSPGHAVAVHEVLHVQPARGWSAFVHRTRTAMWAVLDRLPPDSASLVAGLAIGDDSRQSARLADAMRDSGLSHLTAVSGGNLAIIAGLVVGAVALLRGGLRMRVVVGTVAIVGYAAFVGPEPSVLRASVMGAVALVGLLRGGRGGGYPLLGLAVLALVIWRPTLVLSWGFALSVAATGGILWFAPRFERALPNRSPAARIAAAAAAVTLGAQLATAPLLAAMTGQVPLAAVPANLVAAPLVAPITVLGLIVAVLSPVSAPVAGLVAWLAEPFGSMLATIAGWAAGQSWATLATPDGWLGAVLVAGASVMAWQTTRVLGRRWTALLACLVVVAGLLVARPPPVPRDWLAAACDVGQGDAFAVRAGPRAAVLIDTGPDPAAVMACLERLGVAQVPLLILTHFDTDHVAATEQILADYRVERLLVSPVREPAANAEAVQRMAAAAGVPESTARPGMQLEVGTVRVRVLWPARIIRTGSVSNNAAVATEVTADSIRMLFTGDLEPTAQAALMAAHDGGFDVTTIPHHGSPAQHPAFLAWTGARIAWVSAGSENRFGHPADRALDLAEAAGQAVGRTDQHGMLVLVARAGAPALIPLGRGPRMRSGRVGRP